MRILCSFILAIALSGCAGFQTDICAPYPTLTERSYCYVSNEVTAATNAVTQSLIDKSITVDQAKKAQAVLDRADAVLDDVERLIMLGDLTQADVQLTAARTILLELKR